MSQQLVSDVLPQPPALTAAAAATSVVHSQWQGVRTRSGQPFIMTGSAAEEIARAAVAPTTTAARSFDSEAIKFSKHPRDRMKIRNAKISRAAYAACKRLRTRELLQIVYRSNRLRTLLERHAIIDCFEDDVERFKLRRVLHPDEIEQERFAKYPSLRLMSGSELRIETLVASN